MIEDIKDSWLKVVRRCQSKSKSDGYSIVTIKILCNANGEAELWTEPQQVLLEPKSSAGENLREFMLKIA